MVDMCKESLSHSTYCFVFRFTLISSFWQYMGQSKIWNAIFKIFEIKVISGAAPKIFSGRVPTSKIFLRKIINFFAKFISIFEEIGCLGS